MTDQDRKYLWPIAGLVVACFLAGWPGDPFTTILRVATVAGLIYYVAFSPTTGEKIADRLLGAVPYIVIPLASAILVRWVGLIRGWNGMLGVYAAVLIGMYLFRNSKFTADETVDWLTKEVLPHVVLGSAVAFVLWVAIGLHNHSAIATIVLGAATASYFAGGPTVLLQRAWKFVKQSPRTVYALLVAVIFLLVCIQYSGIVPNDAVRDVGRIWEQLHGLTTAPTPPTPTGVAALLSTHAELATALVLSLVTALLAFWWRNWLWAVMAALLLLAGVVAEYFGLHLIFNPRQLPPHAVHAGNQQWMTPELAFLIAAVILACWILKSLLPQEIEWRGRKILVATNRIVGAVVGLAIAVFVIAFLYNRNQEAIAAHTPPVASEAADRVAAEIDPIRAASRVRTQQQRLLAQAIENDRRGRVKGPALLLSYKESSANPFRPIKLADGEELLIRLGAAPKAVRQYFNDRALYYGVRLNKYGVPAGGEGWVLVAKVPETWVDFPTPSTPAVATSQPTPQPTPQASATVQQTTAASLPNGQRLYPDCPTRAEEFSLERGQQRCYSCSGWTDQLGIPYGFKFVMMTTGEEINVEPAGGGDFKRSHPGNYCIMAIADNSMFRVRPRNG